MTVQWLIVGYAMLGGLGMLVFLRIVADELLVRERSLVRVETILEERERKLVAEIAANETPVPVSEERYELPPMPPPKPPSSRG